MESTISAEIRLKLERQTKSIGKVQPPMVKTIPMKL